MNYRIRTLQALFFFTLGWQLSACIREEVAELPEQYTTPRLFVYGVLSVDDWIRIYVAQTVPYGKADFKQEDFRVDEAVVTLRDDRGRETTLRKNSDDPFVYQVRQSAFPLAIGQTYHLRVEASGFTPVTASTTIPAERADWKRLSLLSAGDVEYVVNGYWDTLQNDHLYGYGVVYSYGDEATIGHGNEGIARVDGGYSVQSDLYMGGRDAVRVLLLTRDEHFSAYSKASELATDVALNYTNAYFVDFISGFKGVFPYYSNIEGGTGLFGSFRMSSQMLYK
ncbi:MAG: DUF4249 family protein [Parapedobacter sp.]|nr:MAG: DUF4249 family protein [Parapedobacter sp.]